MPSPFVLPELLPSANDRSRLRYNKIKLPEIIGQIFLSRRVKGSHFSAIVSAYLQLVAEVAYA